MAETAGMREAGGVPLLEREAELERIGLALAGAARGNGSVVVVEGPAGIGKTSLLNAARGRARQLGFDVLGARSGELERDFGLGVARKLLEPGVRAAGGSKAELLGGAAAIGAAVLGTVEDPQLGGSPTQAALHGLYWLVANLAEPAPLLLAVDDAHWADEPSLRFLHYLGGRLDGLPILLMLAARSETASPQGTPWQELRLELQPPTLRPEPLSEMAGAVTVRAALGEAASEELCAACHRATGGNPFFLTELLVEIQEDEGRPSASAEAVAELGPERIAHSVLARVRRLSPQAPVFARALAVLGPDSPLRWIADLAELDPQEASEIADLLTGADVVSRAAELSFVHPVVRTSIYEDTPAAERSRLHRRAAGLLAADGEAPEAIAGHLLATESAADEEVVAWLRRAARAAQSRGAPETAARYLRRAIAEPPSAELRGTVLLELGTSEFLGGELPGAEGHLRQAIDAVDAVDQRQQATVQLAGLLSMTDRPLEAIEALRERIEELADDEPALAAQLESHGLNFGRMAPEARNAVRPWQDHLAERVAAGEDDPLILAAVAADMAMAGEPADRTAALAERALASFNPGDFALWSSLAPYIATRCLVVSERFEPARATLDAAIAETSATGSAPGVSVLANYRSELRLRLGDLAGAEEDARFALEIARTHGPPVSIPASVSWLVDALTEQGRFEEAERLLEPEPFAAPAAELPGGYTMYFVLAVRGRLRLATGRLGEAAADLLECGRRMNELGELSPGLSAWRRGAATALAGLGEATEAKRLAGDELERARIHGGERAVGAALRAVGTIEGGAAGTELLRESVAVLERTPARLERARALVDLGAALRRDGQRTEAREALALGMDLADRCGAIPLSDRAREELVVAGARPRRRAISGRGALTASELRVAELAASGMTNKEIAQSLFVTLRTIEMHLSSSYRKLSISSRRELPAALEQD
jgi:DNA-binding CsgD family transcriptional regulator